MDTIRRWLRRVIRPRLSPARFSAATAGRNLCFAGLTTAIPLFYLLRPLSAASASPQPQETPSPALANPAPEPTLPPSPSQADRGAQVYWLICLACHGDRGQGLTDEWRQAFGPDDANCWQSKCHASNHPPQGFELPHVIPAVTGPGTLTRYATAKDLFDYIAATMPWWNPGSLTTDDAWDLTAFLLRERGALPAGITLDLTNAFVFRVNQPAPPAGDARPAGLLVVAMLTMAALGLFIARRRGSAFPAARAGVPANPTTDPRLADGQGALPQPSEAAGLGVNRLAAPAPRARRRPSFFYHLHPPTIPAPQARFRYTLGAGGLATFFVLVLIVTGALEMFFYVPTPDQAAISIQTLTHLVPYGGLIRNLHYWSTQALLAALGVHLLRVVLTGAYAPPRRFNYLLGLALLVISLLLSFSGYVLRWDQGVHWALIAGTNLVKSIPLVGHGLYGLVVGGDQPGPATLLRFYAWHIFGLTLALIAVGLWHLFRVRRDGGIAVPPPAQRGDGERITRFELVEREVLAMILAGAVLVFLSAFFPAPIAPPVSPESALATEARAPWFFLWLQHLLRWGDPFWMGVFIPVGLLALLALLPYVLPRIPPAQYGRWFPKSGRAAQLLVAAIFCLLSLLAGLELLSRLGP